jgi:hypothetical protein
MNDLPSQRLDWSMGNGSKPFYPDSRSARQADRMTREPPNRLDMPSPFQIVIAEDNPVNVLAAIKGASTIRSASTRSSSTGTAS